MTQAYTIELAIEGLAHKIYESEKRVTKGERILKEGHSFLSQHEIKEIIQELKDDIERWYQERNDLEWELTKVYSKK